MIERLAIAVQKLAYRPLGTASARTLNVLAALVWHGGGFVLLLKAKSLLLEAASLNPGQAWPWLATVAGFVLGLLKAHLIFRKSCHKNLDRIAALSQPRVWQFFRPGFFFFLALMIATGATLSRMAQGNYGFLIAVATLDLSIGSALLGSALVFWKRRAFG